MRVGATDIQDDVFLKEIEFTPFPKIPRLKNGLMIITEKIDGTNAQIAITNDGRFAVGSRTRWITPDQDNYSFAKWAYAHEEELREMGPGRHFGEWWGLGIQRGYGVDSKRFSLFNTLRWGDGAVSGQTPPACCSVVPVLYSGPFDMNEVEIAMETLKDIGSFAAPFFMNPEGVVIYHTAGHLSFKYTFKDAHKGES